MIKILLNLGVCMEIWELIQISNLNTNLIGLNYSQNNYMGNG
jgi:hypothetical protein